MKDASVSLGIYFEIKDADLYGGEGTTGYAATIVEISIEGLQNADFEKYANSQLEAMASMAKVPKEKVRIISKDEYKELLDKLSKIVRLPPAIENYRQRLDETQRAVDKMRIEKEPEALVKYPVQGSLYEHQVRAANMALLTFGLADPKEVLK